MIKKKNNFIENASGLLKHFRFFAFYYLKNKFFLGNWYWAFGNDNEAYAL
jgi:hypothetical protein